MCGILGQLNTNGQPVRSEDVAAMLAAIRHRGPDDHGVRLDGALGFGHARLSIIDLSPAGHQPMSNEDGTVWIIFNGEIYNFAELRPDLERRGHRFRSHTDTEVILHLWEEHRERCLQFLRGMFAFALWDVKTRTLFVARDRVGKKPLKYFFDGTHFLFASEIKALLRHPLVRAEADLPALGAMLALNHVPAPATGFRGIAKLPAAHYALLQDGKLTIERYWSLDFRTKTSLAYPDAMAEVLRLLRDAVRLRLIADVPVGAFLSGGIDSSAVVALMSEVSSRVKTFSIGFPQAGYDERAPARLVAERFGTTHTEFEVVPSASEILPKLVAQYDEPYADSSALPTFYLAQLTRQHVTVALNGDGGDEAFGGYERYRYWHYLHRFIPNFYRRIEQRPYFSLDQWPDLLTREFVAQAAVPRRDGLRSLDDVFALSFQTFLPDDLLTKVDIATMAFGLEGRSPLLDHVLLEFAARLPAAWKISGWQTKAILKDSLAGLLPDAILRRPKRGFELPVDAWFRDELYAWAREILLDSRTRRRGILAPAGVERLLTEHRSGRRRHGQRIWTLLCLELWFRAFGDSPIPT